MTYGPEWAADLRAQLDALRGLSTSKPDKYGSLNRWLERELGVSVARCCHVSGLAQQWTARLGQVLMACPEAMVVLSAEPLSSVASDGRSYLERLASILNYVGRIELVLVCCGSEGKWCVEYVLGPQDGFLSGEVADALPEADHVLVDVRPLERR